MKRRRVIDNRKISDYAQADDSQISDNAEVKLAETKDQITKKEDQAKTVITIVYTIIILFGLGTGFVLARDKVLHKGSADVPISIKTDRIEGITDPKTFPDTAEGIVEKGGIDGEGTHKLAREGGPSQTAYMVSSVIDLDKYVGKKVRVWGQTIAAQKAAWLMDIGKIELL